MKLKTCHLFISLLFVGIVFNCQRTTSPYLNNYDGDYSLFVDWNVKLDSMEVLKPYKLSYKSTGKDSFLNYKLISEPSGNVDTNLFKLTLNDSTAMVLFLKPFIGNIKFIGIHPNTNQTEIVLPVKIVNNFKISGIKNVDVGNSVNLRVLSLMDPFMVQWFIDGNFVEEISPNTSYQIKSDTAISKRVFAIIKDSLGHRISTDTVSITFSPLKPTVNFYQDYIEIPLNQESSFPVKVTNADSIQWVVKRAGLNRTTEGVLKHLFTTIGKDTVIATAVNKYGMKSDPDTLYLNVIAFNYSLKIIQFPDTIRVKKWATWKVQATKNGESVNNANVVYSWITVPDSSWDSLKINSTGDELSLKFLDSVAQFNLSVQAKIGNDSTYKHQQTIITRKFKPSCSFTLASSSALVNQNITGTVKANDSDPEGSIAGIYYFTSDNLKPVLIDGTNVFTIKFLTPGQKKITCFALDNEGFISDSVNSNIIITTNKPYFVRSSVDTTMFINNAIRLSALAKTGNEGDTIKTWQWDINNDGIYDRTTSTSYLDTIYKSAGIYKVKVNCIDNRNQSSETTMIFTIRVERGTPVVKGISPDTVWVNKDNVFKILAADTNGIVKQWAISWDIGLPYETKNDSSFSHIYSNEGMKQIRVYVVDNDNIASDTLLKNIYVKLGKPIVLSVVPDSIIFINDLRKITISTLDSNGTVDSIKIDNGNGNFGHFIKISNNNYTYNKTFARTEAGTRVLRVIAKDNDGIASDTAKYNISVRLGTPKIDSVSIDTTIGNVFVNDLRKYTVFASDTNGSIKTIYASWTGGANPDDSIVVNFTNKGSSFFSHAYDTSKFGNRSPRFWVRDEDSIMSSPKDFQIFIRFGAPVVNGTIIGNPDTCFAVVTNGPGNYYFRVMAEDTNGFITKYFWNASQGLLNADSTDVDSLRYNFPGALIHTAFDYWVYVRDDDRIIRGKRIIIYADSVPVKPEILNPPAGDITNGITLRWRNKDAKDGNSTFFQVLIGYNGSEPSIILSDFKPGTAYSIVGNEFRHTFIPNSGIFKIKIVAKDARGSKVESDIASYSY